MFIAMNHFKVIKEERKAFEDLWVTRQSRLDEVKGFCAFHLLRGPEREDHALYSSHTIWASQEDFTAWTKSEQSAPRIGNPHTRRACFTFCTTISVLMQKSLMSAT